MQDERITVLHHVELPGLAVSDLDIEIENNVLTISGERAVPELAEGERRVLAERNYGRFQRTFTLPRTVDADRVTASFDNGMLTVHLPKAPEAKGRKIEVRSEA